MLVDANILLYSVDRTSPFHPAADSWLTAALNGDRRVGIPWISLWAFVRIATNPRAVAEPLTPQQAWAHVATWIPTPGYGHASILHGLLARHDVRAGLVPDAVLAAICIEHGLSIVSATATSHASTRSSG